MNGYTNGTVRDGSTHVLRSADHTKMEKEKASLLSSISSLTSEARAFKQHSSADKATRYEVRTAALALADALEDPVEQALRIIFESAPPLIALRVAFEAGFLNHFGDGRTQTADSLSKISGADRTLIARIFRILTASKMVDEVGVDTYAANDLTRALLKPGIGDANTHGCDTVNPIFNKLPDYLNQTSWVNPDTYTMGPHVFTYGKPLYKRLQSEPSKSALFNKIMSAFKQNRENWVDIFPFEEKQKELGVSADQVLVIDIAGGVGHRLRDFKLKFSGVTGRAVLQDQAHVLPTKETNPKVWEGLKDCGIETMAHDIFEPQPIQAGGGAPHDTEKSTGSLQLTLPPPFFLGGGAIPAARYYFFSAIFHGRPNSACLELLRNTAPALKRGYSRILINDFVIPEKGANLFQASFDLWMMADSTGQERTLREWNELFDACGLKLVEVHTLGIDSVLEVELA